ncbi:MAG: LytR C-terminal domain-containing protein [Actinobacteria bacterium]|nr:LytR C-terminal domain-containing protein [Actinomycetota bacterium]MCG2801751.1 LytR C-terminal domain-containing protein [Cellulomonas sp.]
MSKASYPYPDDEFDTPADPDGPRGIHRAPRSAWSRWWPFLVVIVVVPLIAFGGVWFAARNGYVSDIPGLGGASSSARAGADDEASADAGAPDDGTSDAPSESAAAPQAPAAPAPSQPAGPVLSTKVNVVNAAGVSGLAATAATKLQAAGFTAVTTGNGSKGGATSSTVFYASEGLATTAQQVATTLGLTTVTLSADKAGGAISVVLVAKLPG